MVDTMPSLCTGLLVLKAQENPIRYDMVLYDTMTPERKEYENRQANGRDQSIADK